MRSCPCQENCPTGCPCPYYQCRTTTTSASTFTTTSSTTTATVDLNTWVLVMNTYSLADHPNIPLLIDGKGQSKEIEFNFASETEVSGSCSIVWLGKMFVFGGYSYQRQISVVDGCELKKKGELTFDMYLGACAQRDNQEVYICFELESYLSQTKNCRRSIGPLEAFTKLPSSTYDHRSTRIAVTSGKPGLLFNLVLVFRLPYRCW